MIAPGRSRQAAELLAVLAIFAFVACVVVRNGGSGQPVVLGQNEFQNMWQTWLHKVENQVDAAEDLSKGLSKTKEKKLNNLLENDVKHDVAKEKKMVSGFDGGSDSSRVKKAVRSAISKPSTSSKAASKAVRAAMKAVKGISKGKEAKISFEDKSQREQPVPLAAKNVISPFSKNVQNSVSRDDAKVAREEARVKAEERQLMGEEGVHQTKQAQARHAIHAATKTLQTATKPLRQAHKATKPASTSAQKRDRSDSISSLKARDDAMESEATIPAKGAAQEMAAVMAKSRDLKMMQGALAAVLHRTDKDPEAAKEAAQEEKSWGGMLKSWGLKR